MFANIPTLALGTGFIAAYIVLACLTIIVWIGGAIFVAFFYEVK